MDYSENYLVLQQNTPQNTYFNSKFISLLTSVIYYNINGEIQHKSAVVLSDYVPKLGDTHDTGSAYTGYVKLNEYMDTFIPQRIHTIIQTDGSSGKIMHSCLKIKCLILLNIHNLAQFKNRFQLSNLCYHSDDFNNTATWIFSSTGRLIIVYFQNSILFLYQGMGSPAMMELERLIRLLLGDSQKVRD